MSYQAGFKGKFEYKTNKKLLEALKVIDEEEANPDESERNGLGKEDFEIDSKGTTLKIAYSNFMAASSWYGSYRTLCKMSKHAIKGKIKCSFEGDPDEWVRAGRGYD